MVQVADTTLNRDRAAKKFSYALAGITEYWIINVFERQVERFTEPDTERGDYAVKETFKPGASFSSEHLGEFAVSDLLTA